MKLPIDGAEHAIISDEILNLPSLPKKLAVIGGGYIGLEFAGIYNNYGSAVHVVYRQVSPASYYSSSFSMDSTICSFEHASGRLVSYCFFCSCIGSFTHARVC